MASAKILLVEDDEAEARNLARRLERLGYRMPVVLHRGDDAVPLAREAEAEIALVGVRLSGPVDGMDAARSLEVELGIPVIHLASPEDEERIRQTAEAAPRAFLVRPFRARQLRTAIDGALQRHRLEEALRRSEERYSKIFRTSPVAIAITAVEGGRVLDVNEAFVALSGWNQAEAVGRTVAELGWWAVPGARERILRTVRREGAARESETGFRTRAGEIREVLVSAEIVELVGEEALLVLFHDVSERARVKRELERLVVRDALTGLPNRTLFRDRLAHALDRARRERTDVAVLLMDLDRFKVVNDTLGHMAGDRVLKALAERFQSCLRKEDTLARLGGDEFGVVLEDVGRSGVREAADRLGSALERPFRVKGTEFRLSVSIGIAAVMKGQGRAEDMIRFSDIAMYRAKALPGTNWRFFDPARDAGTAELLHRENDLRRALKRDEFVLVYQPLVHLRTGKIAGCEALLRWEHPERGLLPPSEFIPLAEDMGLIRQIGQQALERAVYDVNKWRTALGTESFTLSVNLSPRDFQEHGFIEGVEETARRMGVPPASIQLEITETLLLQAAGSIRSLRDLGFRVAIDDFGTGYSSLRYLKELEVDTLKVDGSFVQGIGGKTDELIIPTIVRLAHALGLEVVAEWVETQAQHRFLRNIQCDFGQGYLYSTPLPEPLFAALLSAPATGSASSGSGSAGRLWNGRG